MSSLVCPSKCCTLKIVPYANNHGEDFFKDAHFCSRKAGVVLYDPHSDKVLIVQSRGRLWGPPKGTLQYGESQRLCAVREVKEETGLDINADSFMRAVNLSNRAIYFYMETSETDVSVQTHIVDNDANGVGWIKLECLEKCVQNGNISLSKHCQIVLKKLLGKTF
jgi:ADP-ribose pyrophosphatase YjhB (NUDIX family)